jgi:hypothetical protein
MEGKIIQSYVGKYFVSTINHDCSNEYFCIHGTETIVFELNGKQLGRIVYKSVGSKGDVSDHFRLCKLIIDGVNENGWEE